jgi:hypothetical protein
MKVKLVKLVKESLQEFINEEVEEMSGTPMGKYTRYVFGEGKGTKEQFDNFLKTNLSGESLRYPTGGDYLNIVICPEFDKGDWKSNAKPYFVFKTTLKDDKEKLGYFYTSDKEAVKIKKLILINYTNKPDQFLEGEIERNFK